jgi:hypothetical protein
MRIELDADAGLFRAYFEVDAEPFKVGDHLDGRIRFEGGHIASAIVLS